MRRTLTGLLLSATVATAAIAPTASAVDTKLVDRIANVVIQNDGTVSVDLATDTTQAEYHLCNLNEELQGVKPQVCQGWLSILMAAHLSGKQVRIDYGNVAASYGGAVQYLKSYDH